MGICWKFTSKAHRDVLADCRYSREWSRKISDWNCIWFWFYALVSFIIGDNSSASGSKHIRHVTVNWGQTLCNRRITSSGIDSLWNRKTRVGFKWGELRSNLLTCFMEGEKKRRMKIDLSSEEKKRDWRHLRDFITSDIKLLFRVTANKNYKSVCPKACHQHVRTSHMSKCMSEKRCSRTKPRRSLCNFSLRAVKKFISEGIVLNTGCVIHPFTSQISPLLVILFCFVNIS